MPSTNTAPAPRGSGLSRAAIMAFGAATVTATTACPSTISPVDAPVIADTGADAQGGIGPLYGGVPADGGPVDTGVDAQGGIGPLYGGVPADGGPVDTGVDAQGGIGPLYGGVPAPDASTDAGRDGGAPAAAYGTPPP